MQGEISRDAILRQMEAVLATPEFAGSPRIEALLRYLVGASLDGEAQRLKGYSIGIDVFGRDASFDPMQDSIVRVQVGRLRKMLAHFYAASTGEPHVLIEIPKGQYAARFSRLSGAGDETDEEAAPSAVAGLEPGPTPSTPSPPNSDLARTGWRLGDSKIVALALVVGGLLIVLAVLLYASRQNARPQVERPHIVLMPFDVPPDGDQTRDYARQLREALAGSLARQKLFPVVMMEQDEDWHDQPSPSYGALPLLHVHGIVRRDGEGVQVRTMLFKTAGEELLWSESWEQREMADGAAEQLAARIARELNLRTILAVRTLMGGNPRARNTPWLLYLNAAWVPGKAEDGLAWEQERVDFARRAVAIDPDFAPAHAVLADKLAYLANVDTEMEARGAREESIRHAAHALQLGSDDPNVTANLINHYWHIGDLEMSETMARRTAALNPDNALATFQAIVHPYTCRAAPPEIVSRATAFDASLAPDNPTRWVTQSWLNQLYLNEGKLDEAVAAGRRSFVIFRTPDSSLQLAATLVAAGETGEARKVIQTIAPNWPNLSLGHYARDVIPKRCRGQSEAGYVTGLYRNMAESICGQTASSGVCAPR